MGQEFFASADSPLADALVTTLATPTAAHLPSQGTITDVANNQSGNGGGSTSLLTSTTETMPTTPPGPAPGAAGNFASGPSNGYGYGYASTYASGPPVLYSPGPQNGRRGRESALHRRRLQPRRHADLLLRWDCPADSPATPPRARSTARSTTALRSGRAASTPPP